MITLKTISSIFIVAFTLNAATAQEKSLLWEISGNELESPSYLYGTIHTICPEDLQFSENILNALSNSEQLVLELDMDEPTFMQNMQMASINPGMANISSEFNEKEMDAINDFMLTHYGADMTQLGILKPFVLLSMVMTKGLACEQPGSFEQAFIEYATSNSWNIDGLEEIQDQFEIFDKVPVSEQSDWIVDYITDQDYLKSSLERMITLYKGQDIEGFLDLFNDFPEYRVIEEAMLYERNERWIPGIIDTVHEKPTFFAVGAAHLASDRGVINLLRDKGYTVTPLYTTANP